MTDSPADKTAGKDWRVHIQGQLPAFSVYGRGEETTSAAVPAGAARSGTAAAAVRSAPATPAIAGSAFHAAGADATPRPGISDHVTRVAASSDDSLNNFR
jgi:hypothetical protein